MLHYFYGEDTWAARQAIAALAQKNSGELQWIDRTELEATTPTRWVPEQTGLFGVRVAVIRDPATLPKALQTEITERLESLAKNSGTVVLWDRDKLDARSILWRELKPFATEYRYPATNVLHDWLIKQAAERGAVLESAAANALIARLSPDRWQLLAELEKLTVMATTISADMVNTAIPLAAQTTIFKCLEALAAGYVGVALKSIDQLLQDGAAELYIMAMIAYQFRTLLIIRRELDRGVPTSQLSSATGLSSFVIQKNVSAAKRLSSEYLQASLTRILATDFAIKQGKVDPRTGLYMLVLALDQRAAT